MSDVSDTETDPGHRSRSQSRRARRKKSSAPTKSQKKMPPVPENGQASAQSQAVTPQAKAQSQAQVQEPEDPGDTMQPFEWIGPDSSSMDGPVTYARAQRGEIPKRPGNPDQKLKTAEKNQQSDMMDQDGLKLRIELNIDVEVELKARIQGDLTLALFA